MLKTLINRCLQIIPALFVVVTPDLRTYEDDSG